MLFQKDMESITLGNYKRMETFLLRKKVSAETNIRLYILFLNTIYSRYL